MSNVPFDTNRHDRLLQTEAFLDAVSDLVGQERFGAVIAAIDASVGMKLSPPLLRLGLLGYWLHLNAHAVEDACRDRPALSRFVSSGTPSAVVDIWVFQQIAPRIEAAAPEFAELAAALEDELAARGCRMSISAYADDASNDRSSGDDWASATIVDARNSTPWGTPLERLVSHDAENPHPHRCVTAERPGALVVWPWADATELDRVISIGRDADFSPIAHRLDADRWISRKHLVLEPTKSGVMVRDVGSSNGSMVDSVRIGRNQARLIDGDCLVRLGPHFAFKIVFYPAFDG